MDESKRREKTDYLKATITSWKIAFWIATTVLILLGGYILFSTVYNDNNIFTQTSVPTNTPTAAEAAITTCETAAHQQYDPLINDYMGIDPSISEQYQGKLNNALDACQ